MPGTVMGGPPRVVGITGDGGPGASGRLSLELSVAMAASGARVLIAGVDPASRAAIAACCTARPCGLAHVALPACADESAAGRLAVQEAIETAGRSADRIVLDLGTTTSGAASFFGAAVDDLVLLVDRAPGAAGRSAAYVAALRKGWAREEILVVVSGAGGPDDVAAPIREITSTATAATPRLVPLGTLPGRPGLQGTTLGVLDAPDGTEARALETVAARLLAPRPFPLRGGVQFFVEDRMSQWRAQ